MIAAIIVAAVRDLIMTEPPSPVRCWVETGAGQGAGSASLIAEASCPRKHLVAVRHRRQTTAHSMAGLKPTIERVGLA